jgi:hypothetical protein
MTDDRFAPLRLTSFADEHVWERQGLQRLLRDSAEVIEPGLIVVGEEFSDWEQSDRRVDLLGIDRDRGLVVIELKRGEDAGHAELQALRYAAMVANVSFDRLVDAHLRYCMARMSTAPLSSDDIAASIGTVNTPADARARLLSLMNIADADDEEDPVDTSNPRIILISEGFKTEVTTTVLWLRKRGIDIQCVRLRPYKFGEERIVQFEPLIPLPAESEYQVIWRDRDAKVANGPAANRSEPTIQLLRSAGLVRPGTPIVFNRNLPDTRAIAESLAGIGDRALRAHFGNDLDARENVIWEQDQQSYSLTSLTAEKLRDELKLAINQQALNGTRYWWLGVAAGTIAVGA